MPLSQNGWSAEPVKASINVVPLTVAGVPFVGGVKAGDVHTVLRWVAEQWHARVEPLADPGCWGYAYRDVRAGNTLSNHSSGTAIDLNAPKHPLGKTGTFTPTQVRQIKAICEATGVCRWGGSYSGRADEMHVEVVGTPAQVAAAARRLTTAPTVQEDDMPGYDRAVADAQFTQLAQQGAQQAEQGADIVARLGSIATQNAQILAAIQENTAAVKAGKGGGNPVPGTYDATIQIKEL
jgi:hypothetical protein